MRSTVRSRLARGLLRSRLSPRRSSRSVVQPSLSTAPLPFVLGLLNLSCYVSAQLWMLYTLVPFLLNVILPTLLTIVLLAPALVNLVDSRLPRFLIWDDILDNSSPTKDDQKPKGLPRWKQAGFVLLGLAGASLCAVDGVDQVPHGDEDPQGQLFGWAWYPVAKSIVLTLIWVRRPSHCSQEEPLC